MKWITFKKEYLVEVIRRISLVVFFIVNFIILSMGVLVTIIIPYPWWPLHLLLILTFTAGLGFLTDEIKPL